MADSVASSSTPSKSDKPLIVRVKRKACHSPLEALWLEINERPLKRPFLDFQKLSISDSSEKVEELKTKRVFVQHVETLSSSEVTSDVLQSLVPKSVNGFESNNKNDEPRRTFKTENKQDQMLVKAKQKQELIEAKSFLSTMERTETFEREILSKNARFEQIWRSRQRKKEAMHDNALREVCHVYDIVRVDVEETANEVQEQEDMDLEDHRIMSSYLPLLREFIPSAASEIESNIHDYVSQQASKNDYVYDLYAVKDDTVMTEEDASNPFPLVQVDEDDEFYDGPAVSDDYETDDSNAEDNPLNDYPDEETSEDDEEGESSSSNDESEQHDGMSASNKSSEPEDADPLYEDDIYDDDYGDSVGDAYYYDYDGGGDDDDDLRWSYR